MQGAAGRGDALRERSLPAALLGILLVVAFRGALAGRMFYLRDVSQNHYPIRVFVTERLRALALPLWDPYHGGGTPLLANPNSLVLHPISALFLILPFDAAFTASIVLQFALLAWGGYLLARELGDGREGATLTAAILSLSGPAASLASLQNVLSAAAWVPLALWAYLRAVLDPARRRLLALAALCIGVVLMTGEPASLLAILLLGPGLALAAPRAPEGTGARAEIAPGGPRSLRVLLALLLAGLAIAAAQILPAHALLPLSARGPGFAPEEALKWSLEPARLLEVVVPRVFGDPTRLSPQAWWGRWLFEGSYPFLLSIYLGAIPCLLAAVALARGGLGAARRRTLGTIAGVSVLLALGRHSLLYRGIMDILPAARQIRYPERFLIVASLAVALLAGMGLDLLLRAEIAWRRRAVVVIFGAAAAVFAGLTVVASLPGVVDRVLAGIGSLPGDLLQSDAGAVIRGALLHASLWTFGETAALALAAALVLAPAPPGVRAAAGWSVVVISGLSMTLAAAPALSTAAPGWLTAPSPLASVVGRGAGAPRLQHAPRPEGLSVWATTDELAWGYRYDRFTYALASGHRDHVPTILDAATDRMDLRPQGELARALDHLPLQDRIRILSICGVGFLIAYERLDDPRLEALPVLEPFSRPPTRVYRLRSVLPRARYVARAVRPAHPEDLALSLSDPGFDPESSFLLDEAPGDPGPAPGAPPGLATILEDEPERVSLRVEAPAAGYLVLSDAWSPGWRASVDGASEPIKKANGLFRAVAVTAGAHEVVMTYRPARVGVGLAISGLGLAAVAWWGFAGRRTP